MALPIVGCVTRISICPLIVDCKAGTLINIPVNDWVRELGKPRRIIMDNGAPGIFGADGANSVTPT